MEWVGPGRKEREESLGRTEWAGLGRRNGLDVMTSGRGLEKGKVWKVSDWNPGAMHVPTPPALFFLEAAHRQSGLSL